jgi:hypothetical protein
MPPSPPPLPPATPTSSRLGVPPIEWSTMLAGVVVGVVAGVLACVVSSVVTGLVKRTRIRNADLKGSLAHEFLQAECRRTQTPTASISEAELVLAFLQQQELVDAVTIAHVRRQFRELFVDGVQADEPVEERKFESRALFHLQKKLMMIKLRPSDKKPGSRKPDGTPMVDFYGTDGGFDEWFSHFWRPLIEKSPDIEKSPEAAAIEAAAGPAAQLPAKAAARAPIRRMPYPKAKGYTALVEEEDAPVGGESTLDAGSRLVAQPPAASDRQAVAVIVKPSPPPPVPFSLSLPQSPVVSPQSASGTPSPDAGWSRMGAAPSAAVAVITLAEPPPILPTRSPLATPAPLNPTPPKTMSANDPDLW